MTEQSRDDGAALLRRFNALPMRCADRELLVEFVNDGHFAAAEEDACIALKLPIGETVSNGTVTVDPGGMYLPLYACREEAERVVTVPHKGLLSMRRSVLSQEWAGRP